MVANFTESAHSDEALWPHTLLLKHLFSRWLLKMLYAVIYWNWFKLPHYGKLDLQGIFIKQCHQGATVFQADYAVLEPSA